MTAPLDPAAGALVARLDRIPLWPWGKRVLWIVGFGFFFAFFDIVTIGFALPVVAKEFGVSAEEASWAVSGSLVGYILGALLDARISDRYGRRLALLVSVGLFTIGSLLSATSGSLAWLILWRVVSGMGIGAEIAAVSTYLGELSPARLRGRYTAWGTAAGMFGFALVPFAALALVPNYDWGWRALFVAGGLGGLSIGLLRAHLPVSPHWLLARGRLAEAEAAIVAAEARATARLAARGLALPPPGPPVALPGLGRRSLAVLLRPPVRGRLLLFATVWFVYYLGNYAWLTMAPTLLVQQGFALTSSLTFLVVTGLGFALGAVAAALIGDRAERRTLCGLILLVWAAALALVGLAPSPVTIMAAGFVASTTIGLLIPLLYAYTAENFPTAVRATGVAATDGLGHLGGALAPYFALASFQLWGFAGALGAMAASGLAAALLLTLGVRTRGRSLEAIAP